MSEQRSQSPAAVPVGVSRFPGAASPMRDMLETHDWSTSPLGPPEGWPHSLKTTVGLMLPAMAQAIASRLMTSTSNLRMGSRP